MTRKHEVVEVPSDFSVTAHRDPDAVVAEGRQAAKALMAVVGQKKNPIKMGGEQYLEYEDWQLVARFFGVTAKVTSSSLIDLGGVIGYEASADAIRSDGQVVSSAEAMCLNDEPKWSTRPRYEWRDVEDGNGNKIWIPASGDKPGRYKQEKVRLPDEKVPLFQLRSMAQTRACAKALRNVFAWVVVLAGYRPTVAEELVGNEVEPVEGDQFAGEEPRSGKPVVEPPRQKGEPAAKDSPTQKAAPKGSNGNGKGKAKESPAESISEPMERLLRHNLATSGVTEKELCEHFGVEEIQRIPISHINEALAISKKGAATA